MRLNSIKVSGFKSFAEPTNFQLPGQLVGVVGPNGCGKSNIMDAVRWVLGESKASELRGESMQDVIFNGSGNRKPASRASVELVFDNSDARAGGQWNQFTEIAVKRVLTRDGTSSYYINNQPVRRRDVQDVFLGTGLGPRAYAIIGQGTISRIIESKPEELRLFLEEERVKKEVLAATNALEERLAELRHGEAELETIRQAHYAAGDELHAAQGALGDASLEVSRLEERIRYVIEGRQRIEQRLAELNAQTGQWAQRQTEAEQELEQIAAQIGMADEQSEVVTAQAEEQAASLPAFEDALRAAQGRSNEQRGAVASVQQQIQVLAAESRNIDEQRRQLAGRRDRLDAEHRQLAAPDTDRLEELKRQFAVAEDVRQTADARLAELTEQVPALDDERRLKQEAVNVETARQADLSARADAPRALQAKGQT